MCTAIDQLDCRTVFSIYSMKKKDFLEERRRKLLEYINKNNRANVTELAEIMSVTDATIRRDLFILDQNGSIHRTHGGAIKRTQPSIWQTTTLQERTEAHSDEKERIAQFVVQLVNDGESLMIDGGSTTLKVAENLISRKNMLVVTNSPSIAEVLVEMKDIKVILTGGEFAKGSNTLIGNAAEASLSQYRADKAIIGISGMIVDEGFFSAVPQEAEIKRLMAQNSSQTIVVADSSKIGTPAFSFVCDFNKVSILVTDKNISKQDMETLERQGIEIFIV